MPTAEASQWVELTAPNVPMISGLVVIWRASPRGCPLRRSCRRLGFAQVDRLIGGDRHRLEIAHFGSNQPIIASASISTS
jgi:hypothetical protein